MIGELKKLEEFDISWNKVTGLIPESIAGCSSLKRLYIQRNRIKGHALKSAIGEVTTLEEFKAHDNLISGSIPQSFGNLTALRVLYLYKNKLSGILPLALADCTAMVDLRLFANNTNGGPHFGRPLESSG